MVTEHIGGCDHTGTASSGAEFVNLGALDRGAIAVLFSSGLLKAALLQT